MNRITEADPIASTVREGDGELLSRFLDRRDDAAFAELLNRHGSMVFGVCLRRLGQCQDAEDAYQAVFLALATHGRKLVDRTTVGPWLYSVARQVSTKALRSRSRRRWVFWGKTPEPASPPPKEAEVDLDAALASLSESERSAVILCHLEGLSRAEAAKALAIPEGTLSTRLARALEKLRRKLGKPPLAVLTAAMLVLVPEQLPAGTVGLVRHLRDGTLEDWASPSVLDLYRKALPMRLLDRLGPALVSLLAAVLILVGANFGWQLINAQQPADGKQPPQAATPPQKKTKKDFAVAVEELQNKAESPAEAKATPQLTIAATPRDNGKLAWEFRATEQIEGAKVEHTADAWPALEQLLRPIAESGSSVQLTIASGVSRLEANQAVNICKRAGFRTVHYHGPELFVGRAADSREAYPDDARRVSFRAELDKSSGDLPDWTNGWGVLNRMIDLWPNEIQDQLLGLGPIPSAVEQAGGERGPAAARAERIASATAATYQPLKSTDLAKTLDERQQAARAGQRTITLSALNSLANEDAWKTHLDVAQRWGVVWTRSVVDDPKAFAPLAMRAARSAGSARFEIVAGLAEPTASRPPAIGTCVDPLHINAVLNACRRGGIAEVNYRGQRLFTRALAPRPNAAREGAIPAYDAKIGLPPVELTLRLDEVEGELPDETNGWITLMSDAGFQPIRREVWERAKKNGEKAAPKK